VSRRRELETPRLRLRPCTASDVDALLALWTDPLVRRWLWDDTIIERTVVAEIVARSSESFERAGWGQWIVERRNDGAWLGAAGLAELDPAVGPELLYAFHPPHWGRGYATEASRALLRHAFEALGFARVPGRTDAPNRESIRVLERLGMQYDGTRQAGGRPTVCYSIGIADLRRRRGMEDYERIVHDAIAGAPYAQKLGIVCEEVAVDRVVMRLPWTPEHATIGDMIHGGAIASLVDVVATGVCWATPDLTPGARGTTIGFSISYLRAGRAQDLLATGRIVQRGRSIVIAEVDVHGVDGTHVARAIVTYKRSG
jgi:uncharacterized protein (TIGR00369 family)